MAIEGIRFYADVPPTLQVGVSGNQLVLRWPVSAANYGLETASALGETNGWITVTNVPTISDFQNVLTNVVSTGNQFFRLHKP